MHDSDANEASSAARELCFGTEPTRRRDPDRAMLSEMATDTIRKTATPWGDARAVEQLTLPQRAGERRFATVLELLERRRESGWSASPIRPAARSGADR